MGEAVRGTILPHTSDQGRRPGSVQAQFSQDQLTKRYMYAWALQNLLLAGVPEATGMSALLGIAGSGESQW